METDFEHYERCPICGHLVLFPCLACLLRQIGPSPPTAETEEGDFKLALRSRDHLRYLQVRRERILAGTHIPEYSH